MDEVIRKYCTRCGKPGVKTIDGTQEVWSCPATHGEIARFNPRPPAGERQESSIEHSPAKAPAKASAAPEDDKPKKKAGHEDEQDQPEEVKRR